jgi:hypothetical protein
MDAFQLATSAGPYMAVGALAVVWKFHVAMVNAQCADFRARLTRLEDRLESAHHDFAVASVAHLDFARQIALATKQTTCPLKPLESAPRLSS